MFRSTCTELVAPLLLVTLHGIVVVGVLSRLNPIAPGLMVTVSAPVVITSAINPESEVGSVPSDLEASAVLVAELTYNLTLAALSVVILSSAYDLNPVMFKSASAASAKLEVVPVAVLLLDAPAVVKLRFPEPSVVKT